MSWDENLTNLNYVLAALYPLKKESLRLVEAAGLPIIHIAFQERAIDNWYSILSEALKRDRVSNLIDVALEDYPENPQLVQAQKGELNLKRGPTIDSDIPWRGTETGLDFEKIVGNQSTLLPISFLHTGIERSKSVARVLLSDGKIGSGFLTDNNIFVTNNHVISDENVAKDAKVQFNYQQSPDKLDLEPDEYQFDPKNGFKTSDNHDWTLVKLKGKANQKWGAIQLKRIKIKKSDRVNIIQHPGGGPKQIALYHNVVVYASDDRIQYLTDTLPGSSGSPVFNTEWSVVGVHHAGGWMIEPETKKYVFRNEGININLVVDQIDRII